VRMNRIIISVVVLLPQAVHVERVKWYAPRVRHLVRLAQFGPDLDARTPIFYL
jgi:hypothetical protein